MMFTKNKEGVRAIRAVKYKKLCGWKIYSRTRSFGAEVQKSNIRVKKKMDKYENGEYRLKDKFCFSDLLTKSNRTEIQTYKAGERTFGTPRKRHRKFIPKRFF